MIVKMIIVSTFVSLLLTSMLFLGWNKSCKHRNDIAIRISALKIIDIAM